MSWDLRDSTAKWLGQHWSVDVDLAREMPKPLVYIHEAKKRAVLNFGITPSEQQGNHSATGIPLGDAYVRQKDLIAIFPESPPYRFGYQVDLRLLNDAAHETLAMEIWLSIQTSLLDSHPQLELQIMGDRFNTEVENCWTSKSNRMGLLVHPLDQQECRMEQVKDGLAMRVFGRFMEKGVIRRMRFRLLLTLEPEPPMFWRNCFEEFSESPLPLTT